MDIEQMTMRLIVHGGLARSKSMEAIAAAKEGLPAEARASLIEAGKALASAHEAQAELIQSEADGDTVPLSLLLVHAQDHLMNAITVRDLAAEFVDMYARLLNGGSK